MLKTRILAMALAASMVFQSFGTVSFATEISAAPEAVVQETVGEEAVIEEDAVITDETTAETEASEVEEVVETPTEEVTEEALPEEALPEETLPEELPEEEIIPEILPEEETEDVETEVVETPEVEAEDEMGTMDTVREEFEEDYTDWGISELSVKPYSYSAEISFMANEWPDSIYLIYTKDSASGEDFFPGQTMIQDVDLWDNYLYEYNVGYLGNLDSEWDDYGNKYFKGVFSGERGLEPNTTYYYRIVHRTWGNYTSAYKFQSEVGTFTTGDKVKETKVSVSKPEVYREGYNRQTVVFTIDNPNNEYIIDPEVVVDFGGGNQQIMYAGQFYDRETGERVPNKYSAEIWTENKKVTVHLECSVYFGDCEEKELKGKEITLIPKNFSKEFVSVSTSVGTGSFNAEVSIDPWYEEDYLYLGVFYRAKGENEYTKYSSGINQAHSNVNLYGLESNKTYEYYLVLDFDSQFENQVWTFGSAASPKTFTTKENVIFEDKVFPDKVFRNALKDRVEISYNEKLTSALLEEVTDLSVHPRNGMISSIEGIQHCTNLKELDVQGHNISDASGISGLTKLRYVYLDNNELTELPDLSNMKSLEYANFSNNIIAADSVKESKLPASLLESEPQWIRNTKANQRKAFSYTIADTYYAIGNTHPFIIELQGIKGERIYTVEVEFAGITKKIETEVWGSGDTFVFNDLGSKATGEQNIKVTVKDDSGKTWVDGISRKVNFVGDVATSENNYMLSTDGEIWASATVPGTYRNPEEIQMQVLNGKGEIIGIANDFDIYTNNYEDRYGDIFHYGTDLRRPYTIINGSIRFAKYPAPGEYDLKVVCGNDSYTIKKGVYVTEIAVIENIYVSDEYDSKGDYIYVQVSGLNIDKDKIYPVLYKEGKAVTSYVESKVKYSNPIYKLKKLDKETHWSSNNEFDFGFVAEDGYSYKVAVNRKRFDYYVEEATVLFHHYNYKKGVWESFVDSTVPDGMKARVSVHYDWEDAQYGRNEIASAEGTVSKGSLRVKFKDSSKKEWIPERDQEIYLKYSFLDANGNVVKHTQKECYETWLSYRDYNNSEYRPNIYWDNQNYKETGVKTFGGLLFIAKNAVSKQDALTIELADPNGNVVIPATKLKLSHEVTIDGVKCYYVEYSLKASSAITKDGIYSLIVRKDKNIFGSYEAYVYDPDKFYLDGQHGDIQEDGSVHIQLYAAANYGYLFNNYGPDTYKLSDAEALKIWNSKYQLEVFDCFGNPIKGWKVKEARYNSSNLNIVVTGIPAEYLGVYFKVTDKAGNLGVNLATGRAYYENDYNSNVKYGKWMQFSYSVSSCWTYEGNHGITGVSVNNASLWPVTVTITKPYDTKVLKTFKISSGNSSKTTYDFSSQNLSGLASDEVYDVQLKSADGYYTSNRGYLATEKNAAPSVAVTGVTLNKTTANLEVGATLELTATIKPANATNQLITWESSDPSVAVVSEEGVVTAVAPGKAKITATSDNNKSAACTVSVSDYSISHTALSFDISEAVVTEKLTVSDGMAVVKNVTWASDNTAVVTVDKNGVVTPQGVGTAVITATVKNGPVFTCTVTVTKDRITEIALSAEELTLTVGEEETLNVYFVPNDTTAAKDVTWKTSNAKVARVENGVVTAVAPGTAQITATVGTLSKVCEVTVKKVIDISKLEIPTFSVLTNVQPTLADVTFEDAANPERWSWEYPDTALKAFADVSEALFTAIYTEDGAEPVKVPVPVKVTTITGLSIEADAAKMLAETEAPMEAVFAMTGAGVDTSKYEVLWSSSKKTVAVYEDGMIKAIAKGTATIKAEVTVGGKKFSASYKVTVSEGEKAEIEVQAVEGYVTEDAVKYYGTVAQTAGVITVNAVTPKNKLTAVSNNTGVVKLGKVAFDAEAELFTIPYTVKSAGTAKITFTANDALKTTCEITLYVKDVEPNLNTTSVTINQLKTSGAEFAIVPAEGTNITNVALSDETNFVLEHVDGNNYELKTNGTIKNKTYKNVAINVTVGDALYTEYLTVKVESAAPALTIKQTGKVNLFYDGTQTTEGSSKLTVAGAKGIKAVELTDCDYKLVEEDGEYLICFNGVVGKGGKTDTSGMISVTVDGYAAPVSKKITIATETKALKLTLSNKSVTFNPVIGSVTAETQVRLDGKAFNLDGYEVSLKDKKNNEVKGYTVSHIGNGTLQITKTDDSTAKAAAKVVIAKDTWRAEVKLDCAISNSTNCQMLQYS